MFPGRHYRFEIERNAVHFGRILRVHGEVSPALTGKRCYSVFAGFDQPCAGCPVKSEPALREGETRTAAVVHGKHQDLVRIVEATRRGPLAEVCVVTLDPALLSEAFRARIRVLAAKGQLSPRELKVLDLVLAGHSTSDIAAELEIKVRTVKFHIKNLLAKLGADSRMDLVRLVF